MGQGMTMAEKILARASGNDRVKPGEYVTARIDTLMMPEQCFHEAYQLLAQSGCSEVWDPGKIVIVIDHRVPAPNIPYAEIHHQIRDYVQSLRIKNFYDVGVGICHQVLPEKGHALPGSLIIGGDSHTTTYGAFGAASCGVGRTEVTYVMVKGSLWFRVPETFRFKLKGRLSPGTSAKDIILKIAGQYTAEMVQYKAIEFVGPTATDLRMDQRMTICNMAVEVGAKFAFFEADHKTLTYLKSRTDRRLEPFSADSNAQYAGEYEMDVSSLEPQVACPHNVDHVKPISEIGEIPVQQAFIGSCTNGRAEDLEGAAAILKGRRIHPRTRLLVIPASQEIYVQVAKSGALQTFLEAGAMIGTTGCGPCAGEHMGTLAPGETAISSTNRNFRGRMGSPESFVYLASPETVAASALEGKIADPRKYVRKQSNLS